ncbi:MAG: hypothetical protein WAK67_13275 [Xanthobacteraceae bacterium]
MPPNLIALATRKKKISCLLGRYAIVVIRNDFSAQLIVLSHTIIMPNPCDLSEQASERSAYDLFRRAVAELRMEDGKRPIGPGSVFALPANVTERVP